jgi:hypothetical protein
MAVDTTSLAIDGLQVTAWVRTKWAKPQNLYGRTAAKPRTYSSQMVHILVDCNTKDFKITSSIYYDAQGAVVESSGPYAPSETTWEEPVPDSLGEAYGTVVCSARLLVTTYRNVRRRADSLRASRRNDSLLRSRGDSIIRAKMDSIRCSGADSARTSCRRP